MIASHYLILGDESTGLFPDRFVGPAKWFRWLRPFVEAWWTLHKNKTPVRGLARTGEWVELRFK
jgi:hypothetical protein